MDNTLQAILDAASRTSMQVEGTSIETQAAYSSQQRLADIMSDTQLDIGINNSIIEGQKNTAALATQNAKLKTGAVMGMDMSLQSEVVTGLVNTMNTAYAQKMQAAQAIQEKRSVGFMDNPLQHILNQFLVNDDIDKYQAADTIESAASQHLNDLNQKANSIAQTQNNFSQSLSQAALEASAKNTADAAQLAANKIQIEGIGYNIQALNNAANASKEQLAIQFNVQNAKNQQEHLKLAMEAAALHREEFDWRKDERATAKEGDSFLISKINDGLKVIQGANAPDLVNNKAAAKEVLMLFKSNTPAGQLYQEAFKAGTSGTLGGKPSQVMTFMGGGHNVSFTPAQQDIKTIFSTAADQVSRAAASGTVPKGGESAAFDAQVKSIVNEQLKNIEPGAKNLFNIGAPIDIVMKPGVVETALAQKVIMPVLAPGDDLDKGYKIDSGAVLFSTAMASIKNKVITPEEAVEGITAYYRKGVAMNLATRQLPKFGIVPDELMNSYKTQIETDPGALWKSSEIVNLTSDVDVRRAVGKYLMNQSMDDYSRSLKK